MKYNKIDTNNLPRLWLNWVNSKGHFYVNCETNEKFNKRPDIIFGWKNDNDVLYSSGSRILFAYAKYHEDIDMLELAGVTLDSRRTAKSREWKYAGGRYFIDKEKNIFDEEGKPACGSYVLDNSHYSYSFKNFLQMYHRLPAKHAATTNEFCKFIGSNTFTNSGGKTYEVQWNWHITEWYTKKQKKAGSGNKKGREQKLVDKLTAIPLCDTSDFAKKYPPIKANSQYRYGTTTIGNIVYFERVNNEWSVLRVFNENGWGVERKFREVERFYINDNGANRIAVPCRGGWMPTKQTRDYNNHQFVNKEEAMEKCNRLKYILPLFENETRIKRCLFTALRFPEVEQLIKLGYKDLAMKIATSYTPKADMKDEFGGYYNEKEKNLLRKIGLTKYQLDKHMSVKAQRDYSYYYYYGSSALSKMRDFFGDELIHLNNEKFDKYYNAFTTMIVRCGSRFEDKLDRIRVDKKKFINNMIRIGEKHENAYSIMSDTINMYLCLNRGTEPQVDWYFDSFSDVSRMHDAINELKLQQDAERTARYNKAEAERMKKEEEKRIKLDEERKAYEYEDDNYIIRLPKNGNEIVSEGAKQRICIGGYVSRHSTGATNLFFLRKKSEPDVPFYAIEMHNGDVINQIHGYCNRWLGNNPEAIPTVVRWLRKNGIKCDEKILTCRATGYGAVNSYVPMPVVD